MSETTETSSLQLNPDANLAAAVSAETADILNLLGEDSSAGSCCGGACCSSN